MIYNDGQEANLPLGNSLVHKPLKWVHHNNIGYIFNGVDDNVVVQNVPQTGSWKDINNTEKDDPISGNVFSIWLDHGASPRNAKYCYMVVPGQNISSFRSLIDNLDLQIIQNTNLVQALHKNNKYACVFYQKGSVTMDDGLKVSVDKPVILLIERNSNTYNITVSDPNYTESELTISLNKQLELVEGVVNTEDGCEIVIKLPNGDYQGSSKSNVYTIMN